MSKETSYMSKEMIHISKESSHVSNDMLKETSHINVTIERLHACYEVRQIWHILSIIPVCKQFTVCCSVLQCVAVWCSVVQCVAVFFGVLQR